MSQYFDIKERVLKANLMLPELALVTFTWGNVSEYDRNRGIVAIKPSGVEYCNMTVDDIVVVNLNGEILEGNLKPSSDLETHLEIYRNFENVSGVVHTHSPWATSFAQARLEIEPLGTTHADYFYGNVPCARTLYDDEILQNYELNTGKVIIETFKSRSIDPDKVPACLVSNHGPFVWGRDAYSAVHNAAVLEMVAKLNAITLDLNTKTRPVSNALLDKHYLRKHGSNAYYGQ